MPQAAGALADSNTLLVIALSLGCTFCFAMSTVLKHHSSDVMPQVGGGGIGRIGAFIKAMVSNPLWLFGILTDCAGLLLQVLALRFGDLSVVQPMLTTALVFSLIANHITRRTPFSKRELGYALMLVAGLVLFLWASGAVSPRGPAAKGARTPAIIVGVTALLLVIICVLIARRARPTIKAASLAVAIAAIYACTAALIKTSTRIYAHNGLVELLLSWQLWTLAIAGGLGLVLTQMAFQAGPLSASLPTIASLDPLFSLAIGLFVYGERLRATPGALAGETIGLAMLLGAVVLLSRLSVERGAEESRAAPAPA
ncbi:DMT family transporter [Arsenicicoccus piscis]|uniref:EamA domain-containing protein n=1 Tax=Arsenicicoccus piscis TaxID=673954 RepID=A0ABQ6HQ87_9MICO|nr:DMT family transporter [Arsenicicoccus piscis]MCH8628805.1 DMT family transporter [Arsenicicoccus piscis]GMA20147.1 hypothetical protein GCM10025862_21680 [Arsenicicoccus piscis]